MATVIENEDFVLKQGGGGRLVLQLKSGDVARACKKLSGEALEAVAAGIQKDTSRGWYPHRDLSRAGARRRASQKRSGHIDENVTSGGTRIGSAYVRSEWPSPPLELGHDIVVGGRKSRRKAEHANRPGKKKKAPGTVAGHVAPVPSLVPAFERGLDRVMDEIEKRQL